MRTPAKSENKNPYHFNDMNYTQFKQLIGSKFTCFELMGVAYASKNKLRSFIDKTPFYKWGRFLPRKSKLKQLASRAMDLTSFKIINSNIEDEAADFLANCLNK